VFVFGWSIPGRATAELSEVNHTDLIVDFEPGRDIIDLFRYENPHDPGHVWRGAAPFVPANELQVRWHATADGGALVTFRAPYEASGFDPATWDGVTWPRINLFEGTIKVAGVPSLSRSDFRLHADDSGPAPAPRPFADLSEAQAYRLYDTVLDRVPDAGGLQFWTNHLRAGVPLQALADGFTAAPEFQARYGTPNDAEFTGLLYRNVLDREGEPGGMAFWTGILQSFAATRAEVVVGFSESAEHAAKIAAAEWRL
jgi:hypothetical protein